MKSFKRFIATVAPMLGKAAPIVSLFNKKAGGIISIVAMAGEAYSSDESVGEDVGGLELKSNSDSWLDIGAPNNNVAATHNIDPRFLVDGLGFTGYKDEKFLDIANGSFHIQAPSIKDNNGIGINNTGISINMPISERVYNGQGVLIGTVDSEGAFTHHVTTNQ